MVDLMKVLGWSAANRKTVIRRVRWVEHGQNDTKDVGNETVMTETGGLCEQRHEVIRGQIN